MTVRIASYHPVCDRRRPACRRLAGWEISLRRLRSAGGDGCRYIVGGLSTAAGVDWTGCGRGRGGGALVFLSRPAEFLTMRVGIAIVVAAWSGWALAGEAAPATVGSAIDRGVAFLAADAVAWKNEHHCFVPSRQPGGLVAAQGAERGHAVDEPVLAEMTRWIAESGDGKTGVPRPEGIPKAQHQGRVFCPGASGRCRADAASQAGMKRFVETIKSDQLDSARGGVAERGRRFRRIGREDGGAGVALLPAAAAGDETAKRPATRESLAGRPPRPTTIGSRSRGADSCVPAGRALRQASRWCGVFWSGNATMAAGAKRPTCRAMPGRPARPCIL